MSRHSKQKTKDKTRGGKELSIGRETKSSYFLSQNKYSKDLGVQQRIKIFHNFMHWTSIASIFHGQLTWGIGLQTSPSISVLNSESECGNGNLSPLKQTHLFLRNSHGTLPEDYHKLVYLINSTKQLSVQLQTKCVSFN